MNPSQTLCRLVSACTLIVLAAMWFQACSPSATIEPEPTLQTNPPGAGVAGTGGTGGSNATRTPRCPSGRGPEMVLLEGPTGPYCMDRTEVTKGHYKLFLEEVGTEPHKLSKEYAHLNDFAQCAKANHEFNPSGYEEPHLVFDWTPQDRMHHVDVCDAYAYCTWAGKRLCGKMGGGKGSEESGSKPETSEWMWACTNGGTSKYPTGDSYEPGICTYKFKHEENGENQCRGNKFPYEQIEDLIGGVTEHTSECVWKDENTSLGCGIRGGNHGSSIFDCNFAFTSVGAASGGIRCCADAE